MKYEVAEVHSSAIMQDFRDNEKKNLNGRLAAILDFKTTKFVGLSLCETLHFVLYSWFSYFAFF